MANRNAVALRRGKNFAQGFQDAGSSSADDLLS
jgi:hypothetical protein